MIETLINEQLICLNLQATNKEEVFCELVNLLDQQGHILDQHQFLTDIHARETSGNTGFEGGIALPHAKSKAVLTPALAVGISRQGIDYGAEDGCPSHLFFMIASPHHHADHHISLLAELSSKLISEGFVEALLNAPHPAAALELILSPSDSNTSLTHASNDKGLLLGVTGCPAGIAHTYLAAEALTQAAHTAGYRIKVETNGAIGIQNRPTEAEIAEAEAVLVCCDKSVDLARFTGKKLIKTGVKAAINHGETLIQQALTAPTYSAERSQSSPSLASSPAHTAVHNLNKTQDSFSSSLQSHRKDLYLFLMNGVSHMIPFVITGGLLIALALSLGGQANESGMSIPEASLWHKVLDVGDVAFTLMIPILAGYIAYAIADRPALAPGLIGGWIANHGSFYHAPAGTGFIGAMIAGLCVGYFVRWLTQRPFPNLLQPLLPIMIAPIAGSLMIAGLFIYVIGAPIASTMQSLNALLSSMSSGNIILLGILLGGMTGFDMGGPCNKVAFLFSVGMIASGQNQFMGAMACAIPVAPLGMGLATLIGRQLHLFNSAELEAGKAAGAMGLVGISEGAIPFAAQDPICVIPANIIGSMLAAVLAFSFNITDSVAHGGPIVALLGAINEPLLALLCMAAGSSTTAVLVISFKKFRQVTPRRHSEEMTVLYE